MTYYLAASLTQLRDEINNRWPNRDKSSDGWIGDTSHAARYSSHNPLWTTDPPGAVRAIDVDKDGINVRELLNEVIGDPRVWYVIFDRKIYSRTYDFAAQAYTGSNPHEHHVHISLREAEVAYDDATPWFGRRKTRSPGVDVSALRKAFESGDFYVGVRRVQRALNARYDLDLTVDGYPGRATRNAWRRHERAMGLGRPNPVPQLRSLRDLARGRFAVRR